MHKLFLIILLLSFISCSKEYRNEDVYKFNEKIANRTDIETPEELARIMNYDFPPETEEPTAVTQDGQTKLTQYALFDLEGNPTVEITSKNLGDNTYEVLIVHDKFLDDSVRAEKNLFKTKQTGKKWQLLNWKKSWRCWKDRGHDHWGTAPCS